MSRVELVVNDGGYPVKNAGYWRRKCVRLEKENEILFKRIKRMEECYGSDETFAR